METITFYDGLRVEEIVAFVADADDENQTLVYMRTLDNSYFTLYKPYSQVMEELALFSKVSIND
jgi:hypothetical protein